MAGDLVQPPPKGKKNAAVPPHSHLDSALNQAERGISNRRGTFMKFLAIGAFAAAQIACAAQPAFAAELPRDQAAGPTMVGSFIGARMRVPLGATREKAHAGLALTSTSRMGETGQLRFAKGAELGFSGGDSKLGLSLAGRPLSQLAPGRPGPDGRKQGFSTLGYIAIGASVVIIVGGVLIFDYIDDQSE
jgi:hypothetical protein